MTQFRVFGFWKEASSIYTDSIYDFIGNEDMEDKDLYVSYLTRSRCVFSGLGPEKSVLDVKSNISSMSSILTDGVWVWPGSLPFYIYLHKVFLPNDFITHIKSNNYKAPIVKKEIEKQVADFVLDKL